MSAHRRYVLLFTWSAVLCMILGSALLLTPLWPVSLILIYLASLLFWRGSVRRQRDLRLKQEAEWWRRARMGVEQPPLDPCCLPFDENGATHDEPHCTRSRSTGNRVISREENERVERIWKEIVDHYEDSE